MKKVEDAEVITQELVKNPQEYSYRGDEMIEIPASLFLMLYRANDDAVRKGTTQQFPSNYEWVNPVTGGLEAKPQEDSSSEAGPIQILSIEKTFNAENVLETFESWLYPNIIRAKDAMLAIHNKAVEDGIATHISELQKEAVEQKAK